MTPDAAGPVEAVLARTLYEATADADASWEDMCDLSLDALYRRQATALAPLFAEHGAVERQAGAVSALEGCLVAVEHVIEETEWNGWVGRSRLVQRIKEGCLGAINTAALGDRAATQEMPPLETSADWGDPQRGARAAALGDRAGEAVERVGYLTDACGHHCGRQNGLTGHCPCPECHGRPA